MGLSSECYDHILEDTGRLISPLQSLTLDLPPSCIEFCPAHPDYFIIGTYNLQKEESSADTGTASEQDLDNDSEEHQPATATKKTQSRNGSLVVFRLSETKNISHVHTVSYPSALLDLHFHPSPDKNDVMATVSSTGSLSFFQFTPSLTSPDPLKELATHKPLGEDDSVLLLSCAWHPELHNLLAITTSDYQVHVLRIDGSWGAHEIASAPVLMHTLEAWTVAFSPYLGLPGPETSDPNADDTRIFTIYSGGDDSREKEKEKGTNRPPREGERGNIDNSLVITERSRRCQLDSDAAGQGRGTGKRRGR
ncbi:hypothetical protein GGR56DRAFT_617779 [Xylariaceae sp. FL0804]|nr:hypothetical protein GGR56DRAFT_617779 [Xylariaceae sp. FL0804]